ncbi:MAG: hypothetical protein KTR22_08675 [Flavobacteriaceae bacterium]|nr:hypothetical protein [Flavobacteriaceae bacterium]
MNFTFSLIFCFLSCLSIKGQEIQWYSESNTQGIIIQNSFPKGGPYPWPTQEHFNPSYLVFFSRVVNTTDSPIELNLHFSADPIPIPNSPNTFVKVFLPPDTMTMEKQKAFSYGITELKSLEHPTSFHSTIPPNEDCLFYVVGFFYQTTASAINEARGGNRGELILKGNELFYNMLPQIESLPCGSIINDN